jgi:hypothetical protein
MEYISDLKPSKVTSITKILVYKSISQDLYSREQNTSQNQSLTTYLGFQTYLFHQPEMHCFPRFEDLIMVYLKILISSFCI